MIDKSFRTNWSRELCFNCIFFDYQWFNFNASAMEKHKSRSAPEDDFSNLPQFPTNPHNLRHTRTTSINCKHLGRAPTSQVKFDTIPGMMADAMAMVSMVGSRPVQRHAAASTNHLCAAHTPHLMPISNRFRIISFTSISYRDQQFPSPNSFLMMVIRTFQIRI